MLQFNLTIAGLAGLFLRSREVRNMTINMRAYTDGDILDSIYGEVTVKTHTHGDTVWFVHNDEYALWVDENGCDYSNHRDQIIISNEIDMNDYDYDDILRTINGLMVVVAFDFNEDSYRYLLTNSDDDESNSKWVDTKGRLLGTNVQFVLGKSDVSYDKPSGVSETPITTFKSSSPVVQSGHDSLVKLFNVLPDYISAVIKVGNDHHLRGLQFTAYGGVESHHLIVDPELIPSYNKVFNRCDYQE